MTPDCNTGVPRKLQFPSGAREAIDKSPLSAVATSRDCIVRRDQ